MCGEVAYLFSVFVRVLQWNWINRIYMRTFILGVGSQKAEKSHYLLSASWKTGKAGGIIQLVYESSRTNTSDVWGQEKMAVPPPWREDKFLLPPCFSSIQALRELDSAHLHWEGPSSLLSLVIQMLTSPRNDVLPITQAPLSPIKLTYKIKHHNFLALPSGCHFSPHWSFPLACRSFPTMGLTNSDPYIPQDIYSLTCVYCSLLRKCLLLVSSGLGNLEMGVYHGKWYSYCSINTAIPLQRCIYLSSREGRLWRRTLDYI